MPARKLWGPLFVLLIALPIFAHLDELPIQIWDEARVSSSSLEMLQTHNWLIGTYNFEPDMWSTKPPLLLWVQVAFFKLFGVSVLAARMPSAIAALVTCLFIYWFAAKKLKQPLIGIISGLVLVTSQGFIALHGSRTGDYDSLLTMFTTMYCIYYFLYIEEQQPRYLLLSFIFITLAGLTKGVEAVMFLPALFLYTAIRRRFISTLKEPRLYIGIAIFLLFVGGFYLLREHYNPGYLKAVQDNELGGRFNAVIEGHEGTVWYYLGRLVYERFNEWYLLCVFGMLVGLFSKDPALRRLTIFSMLCSMFFLVTISLAHTKLWWYIMPATPFLSIIVALFIYNIFMLLGEYFAWEKHLNVNILPYAFLLAVFITPYRHITELVFEPTADPNYYNEGKNQMGFVLSSILSRDWNYQHMKFKWLGYEGNIYWYQLAFKIMGKDITQGDEKDLKPNDNIAVYQDELKQYIEQRYDQHVVLSHGAVNVYNIHGLRPLHAKTSTVYTTGKIP